jgi:copper(I)-binding protein
MLALAVLATAGAVGFAPQGVAPSLAPLEACIDEAAWALGSGEGVSVSLSIHNDGVSDDRLLGASTPVAWCVRIERTRLVCGRPQTTPLPAGIVVAARATMILEPAAYHLALFGLRSDLVQGETFPLSLHFDRAGEVNVSARVRRKVDAAGSTPLPPITVGDLTVTGASALPAPAATPVA